MLRNDSPFDDENGEKSGKAMLNGAIGVIVVDEIDGGEKSKPTGVDGFVNKKSQNESISIDKFSIR